MKIYCMMCKGYHEEGEPTECKRKEAIIMTTPNQTTADEIRKWKRSTLNKEEI